MVRSFCMRIGKAVFLAVVVSACTSFGSEGDAPAIDAGPGADAGSSVDAAELPDAPPPAPDAAEAEAPTRCTLVPRGTVTPCTTCETEPVALLGTKYAFGLAVDTSHVYWIEQDDRDGKSAGVVKRKELGKSLPAELVTDKALPEAPRHLVLTDLDVWVAGDPSTTAKVKRFPKNCANTCAVQNVTEPQHRVLSMTRVGGDVAFLTPEAVRFGSGSEISLPTPLGGLGGGIGGFDKTAVAFVREVNPGDPTSPLQLFRSPPPSSFPLVDKHPVANTGRSRGASLVVGDCDGLWAIQHFESATGLVRTGPGVSPPRVVDTGGTTFALDADTTHAYFARPDAQGGLFRADVGSGTVMPIVASKDVWSVVVTNEWVYYDEHQQGGTARIMRARKSAR